MQESLALLRALSAQEERFARTHPGVGWMRLPPNPSLGLC